MISNCPFSMIHELQTTETATNHNNLFISFLSYDVPTMTQANAIHLLTYHDNLISNDTTLA